MPFSSLLEWNQIKILGWIFFCFSSSWNWWNKTPTQTWKSVFVGVFHQEPSIYRVFDFPRSQAFCGGHFVQEFIWSIWMLIVSEWKCLQESCGGTDKLTNIGDHHTTLGQFQKVIPNDLLDLLQQRTRTIKYELNVSLFKCSTNVRNKLLLWS